MAEIDTLMYQNGADVYYTQEFNQILEDHLTFFRNSSTTRKVAVNAIDLERYKCDLFGLMAKLNIPPFMFRAAMRTTGITSPNKVPDDLVFILVPDQTFVQQQLAQIVNSVNRIK